MNNQRVFNFKFNSNEETKDIYLNSTNIDAYNGLFNESYKNKFLIGPRKSGKTILSQKWLKINKAVLYNENFEYIINNYNNILIENLNIKYDQEKIFHIINHCFLNNLGILITSNLELNNINFNLEDLISRLKTFEFLQINQPDDDMLLKILTKLFVEKQFIVNSKDIFSFILNYTERSYYEIFKIVEKLDKLSLEKKRELTIPLVKEIL